MSAKLFAYLRSFLVRVPGGVKLLPVFDKVVTKLCQGSFGHSVMLMLSGTVAGQMISVVLSPVLTRLYSPAEFGAFGSVSSIITILAIVALLRLELALPLAHEKKEAGELLGACGLALVLSTCVFFVLVAVLPMWIRFDGPLQDYLAYRWFIPLGTFALGAYQLMVFVATRQQDYRAIAQTKLYQGMAGPFSQITLGLFSAGTWGLIVGFIVGQSVGITALFSKLIRKSDFLSEGLSWAGIWQMLVRFRHFPLISSPAALVSMCASSSAMMVVVSFLFSPEIAGFVFLTDRLVARPLLMLTTSIMQVYAGDMSNLLKTDPVAMRQRFLHIVLTMFGIVSIWLVSINIVAPFCFSFVFGDEWGDVVPYLQALSIGYLFQFTTHGLGHTLQILERQGLSMLWEIGRTLCVALVFWGAWVVSLTPVMTLFLYALVQAVACGMQLWLMLYAINAVQETSDVQA